jgi:hypothetical protein
MLGRRKKPKVESPEQLNRVEAKLDAMIQLMQQNQINIAALYRRTAALAHMIEATSEGNQPRLTKVLRAEIDASLEPEMFQELAEQDPDEFINRYGEETLKVVTEMGFHAISTIGELEPSKETIKRTLQ